MTTRRELVAAITRELRPVVNPAITKRNSSSDLYEAYLLMLIVRAAKAENAVIDYRTRSGAITTDFVFRTAPGLITSTAQKYTYVHIDVGSARGPLEAHLGIRISGKSRVLHEGDVILLLESEANRARTRNLAPRSHSVLFLAEAKFYADWFPLGAARGYMGLCSDLSATGTYLATNTVNKAATRLLDARGYDHESGLVPKSTAADRFVGEIRNVLAKHRRAT